MITWEWDLDSGRFRSWGNASDLLGWRRGEPRNFDERVHPEDREQHRVALARTMSAGEPYRAEFRFIRPDGRVVWLRDTAAFEQDAGGRRILRGRTDDITASKDEGHPPGSGEEQSS
jgi:PAS domain S-box-containing protein